MRDTLEMVFWAIIIVNIVANWRLFDKAGYPGWASIVPFYNLYIMLKVADKPGWWLVVILFAPVINIVFSIIMYVAIAQNFGKGGWFAVGLILLPVIFLPILAFGDARYLEVPGTSTTIESGDLGQFSAINPATSQGWRS
jgi:ABC-type transport system involved in cytochrome c biogenesis permease component